MKGFGDFKRVAVVIIPDDATYKERLEKHTTDAKHNTSENSLNEMKANFTLPSTDCGWFDEVLYPDLDEEAAKKKVQEFNEKGKKAMKEHERTGRGGDHRRGIAPTNSILLNDTIFQISALKSNRVQVHFSQ